MKSWKTTLTLACAAFILAGSTAYGDKYFWHDGAGGAQAWSNDDPDTGYWFDGSGGPPANRVSQPTSSDQAIIEANCCLDADEICASFTVKQNVDLYLDDRAATPVGKTLQLAGSTVTSSIESGAVVHLVDDTSKLEFSDTSSTIHTISDSGTIDGEDDAAAITITSANKTFTLAGTAAITGNLTIDGAGSFTNQGRVEADNSGTLKLAMTGTLDDSTGTNRWKATKANAILKFDSTIGSVGGGSLQGEFVISVAPTAEIEVNEALTNLHRLRMENGLLDVNANLAMGSGTLFMDLTDDAASGSPTIDVAPDAMFTHN